jgi:Raf kinase inhibitor-like YbhB/YbcL family protein
MEPKFAFLRLGLALAVAAILTACSPQVIRQQVNGSLQVTSTSVATGVIPTRSGCKGPGVSPQISWSSPPPGTKSFALIMDDTDAPVGHIHRHYFVHWLVFDVPADKRDLPEGLPRQPLADGTQQGRNDVHEFGYSGPCPDAGSTHHYAVTVYALDTKLGFPVDTTGRKLLTAIDGHISARGRISGTYSN